MCSPTCDSLRTSISVATETVLMVFFGFDSNKELIKWIDIAIHLLVAYSGANQVQGDIIGFYRRN
jgi:hypothetical protein